LGDAGDVEGGGGLACGTRRVGGTGVWIELCKTRRGLLRLTPVTPVFGLRAGFPPSDPNISVLGIHIHCVVTSPFHYNIIQYVPRTTHEI
jgi:hypothetical protein